MWRDLALSFLGYTISGNALAARTNMNPYFKTNLLLVTALALILAGCSGEEKEPEPEVSVQAAPVTKADISRVVNAEAIIFPVTQAVITPKVSAPVRKFLVI